MENAYIGTVRSVFGKWAGNPSLSVERVMIALELLRSAGLSDLCVDLQNRTHESEQVQVNIPLYAAEGLRDGDTVCVTVLEKDWDTKPLSLVMQGRTPLCAAVYPYTVDEVVSVSSKPFELK